MSLQLGMIHSEFLKRVDSSELALYRAYAEIYPLPAERVEYQIAYLQATVANLLTTGSKKYLIKDFLIDYKNISLESLEPESTRQVKIASKVLSTMVAIGGKQANGTLKSCYIGDC